MIVCKANSIKPICSFGIGLHSRRFAAASNTDNVVDGIAGTAMTSNDSNPIQNLWRRD
jgi:hypothetical protein